VPQKKLRKLFARRIKAGAEIANGIFVASDDTGTRVSTSHIFQIRQFGIDAKSMRAAWTDAKAGTTSSKISKRRILDNLSVP
jgi:hypothetical protein